ncbi:MAG: ParB/RepB/Spo0J family partition protein [Candidatus Acidiferrales bacterium]
MTRKALGRGLSALLREVEPAEAASTAPDVPPTAVVATSGLSEIALDLIDTSPFQPRTHFDPQALEELARSMRSGGVVQPVIARRVGSRYELVAGERRLRAARLAGLQSIPTIVRPLSDQQALEISLLENLQREDLNPLEQARAFERLANEFALTQEEIAERTGKDRATIANLMRLLRLPKEVQELVEQGKLTAGHARALLKLEESPVVQRVLARRMAARRISVRQAEQMVERKLPTAKKKRAVERPVDPNLQAAQETLERALGTKVRIIEQRGGRGRIQIDYYGLENLDHIYYTIVGTAPKRPD